MRTPALFHFNRSAFLSALALLIALVLIATVGRHIGWLRGFMGDVLVVVWVYFCLATVLRANPRTLAVAALLIAYAVELSQYVAQVNGWKIANPVLRIIVGSTPDGWDVLAYTLGFLCVLGLQPRK
jgi:uncharacterized membrane protein required for colicin V production